LISLEHLEKNHQNMSAIETSDISGFILAGGKSRRMGTDKALLVFQGIPLLEHMIGLIDPFCDKVFISAQNLDYTSFGFEMIPDIYSDCGPIAGIFSALKYSISDWNLLVSVDVPFVKEELFLSLISNIGETDCIIPMHDSGVEPLIGLYHRRTVPIIEEMITTGDFRLTNLLSKLNTRYVDCNELIKKHPRLFMNINRIEDYQSI
jgi:molybdopterin-guanine dinucleotide biosynthesis protein A